MVLDPLELAASWSPLPATMTEWPVSCADWMAALCCSCAIRLLTLVFRLLMPVTVLICAIWVVSCELSTGLSGSWLFICATSRVRKVFARSCVVPLLEDDETAVEAVLVLETVLLDRIEL